MKVPVVKAPESLKELVNQFSDGYEVYVSKEIQMKGDPTSSEDIKLKCIWWVPTMFGT